jgi:hypothetical protein
MSGIESTKSARSQMSHEEIAEDLREWARGSLPSQAAVEFLTELVRFRPGHPMLGITNAGLKYEHYFLDFWHIADEEWAARTGYMSGGERATWALARSIAQGELEDLFWRLDTAHKAAFLRCLANTMSRPFDLEGFLAQKFTSVPHGQVPAGGPMTVAPDQIV